MILLAGTALAASTGSVGLAYRLSRKNYAESVEPLLDKQVKAMFPQSSEIMPTFKRVAKARAKAKIRPMRLKEAYLMRQYDQIVKDLAEASLGRKNERKIRAAGNVCWKLIKSAGGTYYYYDRDKSRKSYEQLTALEKGRMSDDYLQLLYRFVDTTFQVHAQQFMDKSYGQRVNLEGFGQSFRKLVARETTAVALVK